MERSRWQVLAWRVLVLSLLWASAAPAAAQTARPIRLVVDGRAVASDVPPVLVQGRVLVPLRVAAVQLGYEVAYDPRARTVELRKGEVRVLLTLGGVEARVIRGAAERRVALDVPARTVGGRALVPVRFIAEALGATVAWDDRARQVTIATSAPPAGERSGQAPGGGAAPPGPPPAPQPVEVAVVAREFSFSPSEVRLKKGQPVRLEFRNEGSYFHTLTVDGMPVTVDGRERTGIELRASGGSSAAIAFTPTAAGAFAFYCAVPGHKDYGMSGRVVVVEEE